jgi:hypothetical protein
MSTKRSLIRNSLSTGAWLNVSEICTVTGLDKKAVSQALSSMKTGNEVSYEKDVGSPGKYHLNSAVEIPIVEPIVYTDIRHIHLKLSQLRTNAEFLRRHGLSLVDDIINDYDKLLRQQQPIPTEKI